MGIRRGFGTLAAVLLLFAAALPRAGAVTDHAELSGIYDDVLMQADRVLEIRKFASDGRTPLPGIVFKVYKVATLAQLGSGEIVLGKRPTQEDIRTYGVPEAQIATLTTDAEGTAAYNLTEGGHPDGVYMVVELPDVSGVRQDPFFVQIPGNGDAYTLTVRRSSVVDTTPELSVDVGALDRHSGSADADRTHVRILRAGIPAGIVDAKKYTLSDTLPPQLTYVWGSPVVKLCTTEGEERQLLWDGHFYVSELTLIGDGEPRDHFVITLTRRGLAYIMENLGEGTQIPELRVYYEAFIDEDAVPGEYVFSKARVDYINQYGVEYTAQAESAGICTGGIRLHKTDTEGEALPGVRFRLAREASEAELTDPRVKVEELTVDGKVLRVVFVSFVPSDDLLVRKADTVITDENGDASFFGLAHGTYYIVETDAPTDAGLLAGPVEVRIDDLSHLTEGDRDPTVQVTTARFILPQSGRLGTELLTPIGLGVVCCASLMLLMDHRRGKV